jgi:two-component system phosphate regulon sensor histidine kinase PhoR
MRILPRTIAGRILLVAAVTLVAIVATLVGLVPLVLSGSLAEPASSIGARIVSAVVIAAVVGALAGLVASSFVGRTIASPIERLAERATPGSISAAGWSVDGAADEIERLAGALRRMSAAAAERYATAEAERDRSASLLREMADAVLIVDPRGIVEVANPAAERVLGSVGVAGRPLAEVAREHELLDAVAAARSAGSASGEIERIEPRRSVRLVAHRLPGGDVLVTAQDLTTVRRLETVRRDFVANVSHELRTPIASLKAMAEALEGGALDDPTAARDFVARMHREIDDLAQLVEELLGLARVEGGAELRLERVAVDELLEPAVSRLRALADRAHVSLELDGRAATAVLADRDRIAQVLSNLVHNAVKFTPPGGHVRVGAEDAGDHVRFVVRDTGAGIAREDLDRVFERFFKGERSRATGGTGLGLAIAKHGVLAHGGSITAESGGPGRGSTFSFTLPRADRG